MRLHRQRRRMELRCVIIELRATEIEELIRKKLLEEVARNDPLALRHAVHEFLDQALQPNR